ncbi:MAG: flagellar hook protein FlgE [Gammaproteobacteria bacterium]|nr:MAG: flagellar hook protein FlgE [Gammaproteobacteria bacterium]
MPFNIALSGLNAASQDLKVTGNNIANASTVGFKESRAEFADVFAVAYGGISKTAIGSGVRLANVAQQFRQGNMDFTGNSLDLAINGQGFLIFSDAGARVFSRNGALTVDRDGYVVNAADQRLQVYAALDPSGNNFNTGSLSDLRLVTGDAPPNATTTVQTIVNLSAQDTALGAGAIDPALPATYNYSTSVNVFDSLGASHTATTYFRLVDSTTNTWDMRLYVDGNLVTSGGNAQTTMTFNPDGTLNTGSPIAYDAYAVPGANPLTLTYDYTGSTQYGDTYSVNALTQDGFTTGRLTSVDVDETGVVFARFTNGQAQALGKVALGNFANPQGLQPLGDNAWAETYRAGDLQLGEAGAASFGLIQSGALEQSNVDLSAQLVNLITAQRNFQANAQVITTADTITQTIINIR